ncbi:MAG: energy transducer TonB [Chitinophagaceae bacterium]|jgi:protein TonB
MKKIVVSALFCFSSTIYAQQIDSLPQVKISDLDTATLSKVKIEPSFPGGEKKWKKHIEDYIRSNLDQLVNDRESNGVCIVEFTVDLDGTPVNVHATTLVNSELAKVIVKAIKKGPKWIPATENGKPIVSYRRVPVTFRTERSNQ